MNTAIHLTEPRVVIEPDGETLRVCIQDPTTKEDLVVATFPREFARELAAEIRSVAR